MKEILLNFWKSIIKLLLSKTTLDEKIADEIKKIDQLDEEKTKEEE